MFKATIQEVKTRNQQLCLELKTFWGRHLRLWQRNVVIDHSRKKSTMKTFHLEYHFYYRHCSTSKAAALLFWSLSSLSLNIFGKHCAYQHGQEVTQKLWNVIDTSGSSIPPYSCQTLSSHTTISSRTTNSISICIFRSLRTLACMKAERMLWIQESHNPATCFRPCLLIPACSCKCA